MIRLVGADASFYVWLENQRSREDGVGRLAREAIRDITFPRSFSRLYILLHYYRHEPQNRTAVKRAHAEWRRMRQMKVAA